MDVQTIFQHMASRYREGSCTEPTSIYFSIGDHKYTVKLGPDGCTVDEGKTVDKADLMLKTTPKIFMNLLRGKLPGPIDIARGKIKANDPAGLAKLKDWFDNSGV